MSQWTRHSWICYSKIGSKKPGGRGRAKKIKSGILSTFCRYWIVYAIIYELYKPENKLLTTQQKFVGLQDVFETCLEDVLQRRHRRPKIVTLKTSSRCLEDISWRRLQDISWRRLEDMSWRRLKDMSWQTKCLLGIYVSNKSKCVSNKSIFHKSLPDES